MKNIILILLLLCNIGAFAQSKGNFEAASRYSSDKLKKMVFSTRVDPHWLKDGNRFWYSYRTSEGEKHYLVNPLRRTKITLFDNVKMAADMSRITGDPFDSKHLNIDKMEFINNDNALRISVKSKLVDEKEDEGDNQEKKNEKRKASKAKTWYFEYNIQSRTLRLMEDYKAPEEDKRWATIAPGNQYVLFVRNYNLYSMNWEDYQKALKDEKDSTIVETQLTTDGMRDYSYGRGTRGRTNVDLKKDQDKRERAGWIYFSSDGKYFASIKSDMREVDDLWVINAVAQPRPTLETYKYHMAGEKNAPQQELYVYDYENKSIKIIETGAFQDQSLGIFSKPRLKVNRDDQYQYNFWLSGDQNNFYFQRTSRDLKRIDICKVNAETGKVDVVVEERLNTYVEIRTPGIVNNGQELIHWSERDGWAHFYLYSSDGKLKNQITTGSFHCESIEAIDENNRVLYFTANGREAGEDPYYLHLYKVNFDGTGLTLLNPGNYDHSVSLNDKGAYFVDNYSRVNTVPASELKDRRGNRVMSLETSDLSKLFESGYHFPEPFKVKADDGITDLYGVMYKPFDFDSTKKYPLIEYVYPGPQTEAVSKSFSSRMDRTDRMAQLGFVVITIGNRGGHPARSKWYHNYGYGNLRDYGLADKKYAAEQLAMLHDFIDIDKVGIFGHSGGGFMSTAAMLVYPDFFKVAVSSSGNHENNIYNRWWSEKHHGVKEVVDEEGNIKFEYEIDRNPELAKNLKGKLLITTGDIDNNVHPAGTIRMANALIKANKRFDFFLFPGQRHGYGNMNEYFFWLRAEYFVEHLLGDIRRYSADYTEMQRDIPLNK